MRATRARSVELALRLEPFQELEQRQNAGLAARERKVGDDVAGERDDRHAVEVGECDIGQRRGHLAGIVELDRIAEGHAPRAVEQDVDVQVFLFLEPLEQELVVPGEDVPVEVAEVVARGVLAVVGELDAAAELHRPPLGQQLAPEHPARDQREVFELLQEIGVEKRHESLLPLAPRLPASRPIRRMSSMMSSGWMFSA